MADKQNVAGDISEGEVPVEIDTLDFSNMSGDFVQKFADRDAGLRQKLVLSEEQFDDCSTNFIGMCR